MTSPAMEITVHEYGATVLRYRLKSTGHSSDRYGVCEVCKQHTSEVFHLTCQMLYERKQHGGGFGWTGAHCVCVFGHVECLKARRIGSPVMTMTGEGADANFRVVVNGMDVLIGRDAEGFKAHIADRYEGLFPSLTRAFQFAQVAANHPERRRPVTAPV